MKWLFLILSVTGCGRESLYYRSYVDTLTSQRIDVFHQAIIDLNEKAGCKLVTIYELNKPVNGWTYNGYNDLTWDLPDPQKSGDFAGEERQDPFTGETDIRIAPHLAPSFLYTVILHEIGHGFGLEHSTDPTQIMTPGVTSWDVDGLVKALRKKNPRLCVETI